MKSNHHLSFKLNNKPIPFYNKIHSCKTAPELYCYLLWELHQYQSTLPDEQKNKLDQIINYIKLSILNHHKIDKNKIINKLNNIENILDADLHQRLQCTIKISCDQSVSLQEKWKNPLYRHFESLLATQFLLNPTPSMVKSTRIVSEKIISLLERNKEKESSRIQLFLNSISSSSQQPEAFGKLNSKNVSLKDVIKLLKKNDPIHFHQILLVQYSFARHLYRELSDVSTNQALYLMPGVYYNYLEDECGDAAQKTANLANPSKELRKEFIDHVLFASSPFEGSTGRTVYLLETLSGIDAHSKYNENYILVQPNKDVDPKLFYILENGTPHLVPINDINVFLQSISRLNPENKSSLFLNIKECHHIIKANGGYVHGRRMARGRGEFNQVFSNKMGILLLNQFSEDLPSLEKTNQWNPDAICQEPLYQSPYVQEILNKDLIYISGPSGMATLLLGQMELFACLPSIKLKETYALCATSFIVGGGLHSFHEVITVAHDMLGYYPAYHLGEYQSIFNRLSDDAYVQENIKQCWNNFIQFCDKHFRYEELHNNLKINYREYFESKLALNINESSSLLNAVKLVTKNIQDLLITYKLEVENILDKNQCIEKELYDDFYFGKLIPRHKKSDDIYHHLLDVLSGTTLKLEQTIHTHSVFFRHIFHDLPIEQALFESLKSTFNGDVNDRGRIVSTKEVKPSNRLGIAKLSIFNKRIGEISQQHLCGIDEFSPDLNSSFYQETIGKNIPFISGKSGHAAKLLAGAMTCSTLNLEQLKEYTLACLAYLIIGGNHSFHEVMSVAKKAGIHYQLGTYLDCLPKSYIESNYFKSLKQEFPEFLAQSDNQQEIILNENLSTMLEKSTSTNLRYKL